MPIGMASRSSPDYAAPLGHVLQFPQDLDLQRIERDQKNIISQMILGL
jgi:hypothetical protein